MRATLRLARRATYAHYLTVQQNSEERLEFLDGVIVAMAGGSDEHNAISSRLTVLCGTRLTAGCRHYSPDQRFWIAPTTRGRYSDGSIICGRPEHPAHDSQATTNPIVVFEVQSPSSEGDDEGDKRIDFQSLASLRAYVLVAQDEQRIHIFRRDERGAWLAEPETYGHGDRFELPTLTTAISVAEVYQGVLDSAGRSMLT